jgi:hypothetical protein
MTDVFWALRRVALVRLDVSENVASIFKVIGLHSCVTVKSLLISLYIEEYYVLCTLYDEVANVL